MKTISIPSKYELIKFMEKHFGDLEGDISTREENVKYKILNIDNNILKYLKIKKQLRLKWKGYSVTLEYEKVDTEEGIIVEFN